MQKSLSLLPELSFKRSLLLLVSGFLLTIVSGCSGPVGPITGTVKFGDGSPVQSGTIEFRDVETKVRFAAKISSDGTFVPSDEEGNVGLPPGEYDVVVVQMVLTEDLALESHSHGSTVPRRYADYNESELSVDVKRGQTSGLAITVSAE